MLNFSPSFIAFLDFSRWVAAYLVVLNHTRSLTIIPASEFNPNILQKLFYLLTAQGPNAVIVFFALSGFLVGGSVIEKYRQNRLLVPSYLIDRCSRLLIVSIPAILLGFGLDSIGVEFFNNSEIYHNKFHFHSVNRNIENRLIAMDFFGSLFMLQTIFTETVGSNVPLWSLANEFWYYILFILAFQFLFLKRRILPLTLFILVLAAIIWRKHEIATYFTLWLMGAGVFVVNTTFFKSRGFAFTLLVGAMALSVYFRQQVPMLLAHSFVAFFFLLLLTANRNRESVFLEKFKGFHKTLADFSYSLYAIHMPVLVLVVAIIYQYSPLQGPVEPTLVSMGGVILLTFIPVVIARVFARLTEDKTAPVRKYLKTKLLGARV